MEFVDGPAIHRSREEPKLDTNQRVALFGSVIDAFRSYCQHLVVHRELKPSHTFGTTGVSESE